LKLNKDKFTQEDYIEKTQALKNYNFKVVSFDLYEDIKKVEFYTDNQVFKGDSFAELSYNSGDKACKHFILLNILQFRKCLC